MKSINSFHGYFECDTFSKVARTVASETGTVFGFCKRRVDNETHLCFAISLTAEHSELQNPLLPRSPFQAPVESELRRRGKETGAGDSVSTGFNFSAVSNEPKLIFSRAQDKLFIFRFSIGATVRNTWLSFGINTRGVHVKFHEFFSTLTSQRVYILSMHPLSSNERKFEFWVKRVICITNFGWKKSRESFRSLHAICTHVSFTVDTLFNHTRDNRFLGVLIFLRIFTWKCEFLR